MAASRRRQPSRLDLLHWRAALRDVQPLPGRPRVPEEPPAPAAPATSDPLSPPAPPPAGTAAAVPVVRRLPAPGLDRRSSERLRRGELPIDARIDLHGMTQEVAHRALAGFIGRAQEAGKRCVLVITGKGARRADAGDWRAEQGVLRNAVPRWLAEPPNRGRVLAYAPAQPNHGGGGALYVLLRRLR
jgi:DNA-nicking Smr family endonuclease